MRDFRFLNYHTEYSCTGTISKRMAGDACFEHVFSRVNDTSRVHYKIIVKKGIKYCKKYSQSNACFFSRKEIKNHIRQLRDLYPIKSKVTEKDDHIVVELDLSDVPGTFHKYALTWVRYLYEYPYNVVLKDAYKLKKEPRFRFESIANLFNLCMGCLNDHPREIHQVPLNQVSEKLSRGELKERIQKVDALNRIYKKVAKKENQIPDKIGEWVPEDLEYWQNDGTFEERKKVYLTVYNKYF